MLAKKGYNSEGTDVALKAYGKYRNMGSGTKSLMEFRFGGRCSQL
ncbi:hypothetical protein [Gelidibacter salicanalis]|nr:hypothetical protein [Gelidibacter salicanalis]